MKGQEWSHEGKNGFWRGSRELAGWDQTKRGLESARWTVDFILRAVEGQREAWFIVHFRKISGYVVGEKDWVWQFLGWETCHSPRER